MLYNRMMTEQQSVEKEIKETEALLTKFPNGKLVCARNGKYIKWYVSDGKKSIYLPKKKRALAIKLAAKKYYTNHLDDLKCKQRSIKHFLRHCNPDNSRVTKLLTKQTEYQTLLSSYFKPISQELLEWSTAPFDSNPKYPDQLTHKTSFGGFVRSKSEAMIDTALHLHTIPFRYEAPLHIAGTIIYPDFTIRHPETGNYYYWEHFGLADNSSYIQNMTAKIQLYSSNGITPTIQLITTYETQNHPLTGDLIEKIIKFYFE